MVKRPDAFVASHPMELSALVRALKESSALRYADASDGGITRELLRRAMAASDAADALDRARQLEGYRAAND